MVGHIRVSNFRCFGRPRIISNSKKMPNYGIIVTPNLITRTILREAALLWYLAKLLASTSGDLISS